MVNGQGTNGMLVGRIETERRHCIPDESLTRFKSGATSSKTSPRFDLIPREALECLADRLAGGAIKHGERAWMKGLDDPEFMRDRLNHTIEHLLNVSNGNFEEDDEWGNLGAVMWGCMLRAVSLKRKAKKPDADYIRMEHGRTSED